MADVAASQVETQDEGGDLLLWILVWSELATFGVLFCAFLTVSLFQPAEFALGKLQLSPRIAGFNTVVLVASSWTAALAVQAGAARRLQQIYLAATASLGLGFVAVKLVEYGQEISKAADPAFGSFFELYFLITGFHLAHVVFLALVLILLACRPRQSDVVMATTIWHVVDLIWLVMFPLLYLG
ncbi:cytochrome c oxidase subunit 3 [Pseudorhizobium pelagicum]|uniref:NorE accessory protein for nitric oxide reductase n=1 Tax=Pseudorhizobium pelagicum TaxID=1509405 RepID=A0A922P4V9_9HYPH|nr:cytochrome c oxidase subunit 3 [Pseudorhizobium pelagicum]KEQ03043.1 NorE accessory protein for nitric oxide reductase [Pseudorhizobium pelagicum]KEQ08995.1 NorE accessory protein for nitric oxide reductase [Pseudorhizobium pelagicum]